MGEGAEFPILWPPLPKRGTKTLAKRVRMPYSQIVVLYFFMCAVGFVV